MDNRTFIYMLVAILGLTGLPVLFIIVFIIKKEYIKQKSFFQDQARKRNGNLKKWPPFGFNFRFADRYDMKVYVLQGSFYLKAELDLDVDPAMVMARKFPYLGFLNKLGQSPGKKRIPFDMAFDERYLLQSGNEMWVREIFSPDILENLVGKGRVTRMAIKRDQFLASFMVMRFTDAEIEKADQSIDICLKILAKI